MSKEHNKATQEHKIPEEVLFDIEMQSYMKYNSTIASMNDWVGELYSYQDIKDIEQAQTMWSSQRMWLVKKLY